jgi:hypothetical protein
MVKMFKLYLFWILIFLPKIKAEVFEIDLTTNLYSNNSYQNLDYSLEEDVTDECSSEESIDLMTELILPEDYEHNQKLEPNLEVKHLNQTFAIFRRLYEWNQNVSIKFNPFVTRITTKLLEVFSKIKLSKQCHQALNKVGTAIGNGERWALKCEKSGRKRQIIKTKTFVCILLSVLDSMPSIPSFGCFCPTIWGIRRMSGYN